MPPHLSVAFPVSGAPIFGTSPWSTEIYFLSGKTSLHKLLENGVAILSFCCFCLLQPMGCRWYYQCYNPVTVSVTLPWLNSDRCLLKDFRKQNNSPSKALSHFNCLVISPYNHNRKPPLIHFAANCTTSTGGETTELEDSSSSSSSAVDCVGTGQDVACSASEETPGPPGLELELIQQVQEWAVLVSPFFFWGTAMVAMKGILPKTGPFFISAFRLIPAGFLLIAFAAYRGRPFPSGLTAWLSIALFGLVDAACFQGFLAEGLQRTSAGLGSVIIDSQPLTVAILAALFFGESIGFLGAAGLVLGVIGLLLLEAPSLVVDGSNFSLWQSGEWWMLLSAQSMAVGTVMVRWVSKYSDPIMATGWHMVIGGLPLVVISILNHDNAVNGSLMQFTANDTLALLYTSVFGSAISYGVYFYSATKGSLTKLSSLTFLTPMFASIFGFLYLGETFSPLQLGGAMITIIAIYLVNCRTKVE